MSVFWKFFYDLIMALLTNIARFFQTLWQAVSGIFTDFKIYGNIYSSHAKDFNVIGWIMAVVSTLILLAIVAALIYLLVRWSMKFIRFRKRVAEEEDLLQEVGRLNREVVQLVDEKNSIMAMKVSQIGLRPGIDGEDEEGGEQESDGVKTAAASRFVKLIAVDKKYEEAPFELISEQDYSLSQLVDAFRNFACQTMRLYYDRELIMAYVAGMACSRLIILEGISGTGKTSLPYAWGKFLQHDSAICAVQPSWRDRSELIGYLNEFTKRFNESDFLKNLYEFTFRSDIGFIVLDEMNLARIEYYFAEVLSVLEMPDPDEWKVDVVPDVWSSDPINIHDGKCQVPTNVWFVGTANNDDSTFTITDKVYDRSIPIAINTKGVPFDCENHPPMQVGSEYLNDLFKAAKEENAASQDLLDKLNSLDNFFIENFRLAFGNRIVKQIRDFIPAYVACGGTEIAALDYMLTYKILRKLEGLNLVFLKDNLKKLVAILDKTFGKNSMPQAKEYVERLIKMT